MKGLKKVVSVCVALSMVLVNIACGSNSVADDQTKKAEGKLVIYTGCGPEITDPILAEFNKQYPDIDVEIVKAGSGELVARIKAESGNAGGDVLIGGDPYLFEVNEDIFEPYISETDAEMVVSSENGIWHPWSIMLTLIAVNKDRLPDENDWPQNLSDLTDAKYNADRIAYCDPAKSGTGSNIANNIASLYDWDTFGEMLDNFEVLAGSDPMFDAVKDGTYPIGFVNEDLGNKWLEVGLPIELIYPEDGVINSVDCLSIIKGAKNIDNAKLFIDFFGSEENHEILVNDVLRRSTRKDASLAEGMKATTEYNLIDAERISRDEVTEKFNTAYEISRTK